MNFNIVSGYLILTAYSCSQDLHLSRTYHVQYILAWVYGAIYLPLYPISIPIKTETEIEKAYYMQNHLLNVLPVYLLNFFNYQKVTYYLIIVCILWHIDLKACEGLRLNEPKLELLDLRLSSELPWYAVLVEDYTLYFSKLNKIWENLIF